MVPRSPGCAEGELVEKAAFNLLWIVGNLFQLRFFLLRTGRCCATMFDMCPLNDIAIPPDFKWCDSSNRILSLVVKRAFVDFKRSVNLF